MKYIWFLLIILLSSSFVLAQTNVSSPKAIIYDYMKVIVNSVNSGDSSGILNILSSYSRSELSGEISSAIDGKNIVFDQYIDDYEDYPFDDGSFGIKVVGSFSASGGNWNVKGLSNYYVFVNDDGVWKLYDTNFHQKLNTKSVLKFVLPIILLFLLFGLLATAFWIWMIIDVANRDFDDKTVWLLVVILAGVIGAIIYFFAKRKELKNKGKK